jgi:hypothetical protein
VARQPRSDERGPFATPHVIAVDARFSPFVNKKHALMNVQPSADYALIPGFRSSGGGNFRRGDDRLHCPSTHG